MECSVYDKLKGDLMAVRERRVQRSLAGDLTDEQAQRDAEDEERAIDRLTDHRAEHGCKSAGE